MPEMTIDQALDLAIQLHQSGHFAQAEQFYRQILAQQPDHPEALHLLGAMASQLGHDQIAVDLITRAIAIAPNEAIYHSNLGNALGTLGKFEEAIAAYRTAIRLNPAYADAYSNMGNALAAQGNANEAIASYRQAIALNPNHLEAYNNLGDVLRTHGQLDEAIAACRAALRINPNLPSAHNNLGNALKDTGQLDEAIACFERAVALKPDYLEAHSNLLLTLHYHPGYDPTKLLQRHRQWSQQLALPLEQFIRPHANDRTPDRRLKIGYVSADLREHSVGRFLLPLLRCHDHSAFEIFAYAQVPRADAMTQRLAAHIDHWHSLVGLTDQQAADLIRQDGIDILVELGGHTAGSRLLIFARKPAPVQVSYLGYPNTTGLNTIDYRLTDALADPPGLTDAFYSERLVRLPLTAWCYEPAADTPPVKPPPSESRSCVTFGTFNNFAKVSQATMRLWVPILKQVTNSRLLLKGAAMASSDVAHRLRQFFAREGIDPQRLELVPPEPSAMKHLQWYNRLDMALDTFPYHGTTTTCEAMWMGVPVVSLAGNTHVSRVGLSLLSNVGLGELAADSPDQYVRIAVELAQDRTRLAELRSTLRQRMQSSPLMDAPRFARSVEDAYRTMWRTWCASNSTDPHG